jgi:hypothetical protein
MMEIPIRRATADEEADFRWRVIQNGRPQIARATIAFFGWRDRPIQNGTGVLLRIADRHFVIAAAHVLDFPTIHNIPCDVSAHDQPGPPIPLTFVRHLCSPIPPSRRRNDPHMRNDDPWDVAVVELTPDLAARLSETRRFLGLPDLDTAAEFSQGIYYLYGYPNVFVDTDVQARTVQCKYLSYATELYTGERDARDSPVDLLVVYSEGQTFEGEAVSLPWPHGISGGGVWRLADPAKPIDFWRPEDVRLVGIEHRWRRDRGYVRGTCIRHAVRLIHDHYPDLRPAMRIHYAWIDFSTS